MTASFHTTAPSRPLRFPDDMDGDLLDALRDLADRGVSVLLVDPPRYVDPCGVCPEDLSRIAHPPADAVAVVQATTLGGHRWPTNVCAEHLDIEVRENERLGQDVSVHVPNGAAA